MLKTKQQLNTNPTPGYQCSITPESSLPVPVENTEKAPLPARPQLMSTFPHGKPGFDFQFGSVSPQIGEGEENVLTLLDSNPFGQSKHGQGPAGEGGVRKVVAVKKLV